MQVSTNTLLIESNYFPSILLIQKILSHSNIWIEKQESFQKMSFRNRCIIVGSNGTISLTVPIKFGREQKTTISDIQIDNSQQWQKIHWRTIKSCYAKSPYFEHFEPWLSNFFEKKFELLWDLNIELLAWVLSILRFQPTINVTEQYQDNYEGYVDFRNKLYPKNYAFVDSSIQYPQVFEDRIGFYKNLSVLDLLLNCGRDSVRILTENP